MALRVRANAGVWDDDPAMPAPRRVLAAVAGAGALGLGYSLAEARAHRLRRFAVPVLAPGQRSVRLLHLSDLHLTPWDGHRVRWLKSLADLRPDLVVVTGDFLAHRDSVPIVMEALGGLLDVPGAFVFGSNDYYAPALKNPARYLFPDTGKRKHGRQLPWPELESQLSAAGWHNLTHRRVRIQVGTTAVSLRGVDDPHLGRDEYTQVAGPADPDALAIGVTHAPYARVLTAMAEDGMQLILAGHTHGGQLCVPGWGALVTNCDLPPRHARGLSRVGHAVLHVSAGVGTSPFTPVRFACPPEASLLTLRPHEGPNRPD